MQKLILITLYIAAAVSVQAASAKKDDVTLRTYSTSWSKNNGIYNVAPQGRKYVFVEVQVENKRDETIYCNPVRFELVTRDGLVYDSTYCDKGYLAAVDLRKGQKARGWIAFEIPYDADAKYLIYQIRYDEELRLSL